MIGTAKAQDPAGAGPAPNFQDSDAAVGHWLHRSQTPDGEPLVVKRVCQRTLDGHYLTARTQVQVAGHVALKQQHMMRWDPVRQQKHSWVFSSNGDVAQGLWQQPSDHQSRGKLVGQSIDGQRMTASATYEWIDQDTYIYRLTNRVTGGESLPDIEWDFHRVNAGP
jgi:hypothetical protein